MTAPPEDVAALRRHLVRHRIAGDVATPRANSLRNYRLLSERAPLYTFGLEPGRAWSPADVLALMAERVGVDPDPDHVEGPDRIDVERTLERLSAMGDRLALAAARRERVLLATGHPAGLLPLYLAVSDALEAAGCELLTPAAGAAVDVLEQRPHELRYIRTVAAVSAGGGLGHTHAPGPMQAMLAALGAEQRPGLVVADHGFAGAAGQAGLEVVGFADCNDPALFVGEAEGRVAVAVPLDDNVLPHLYAPVWRYLGAAVRRETFPHQHR